MNVEISKDEAQFMYDLVQQVVDQVGPRMSCSPQEAEGARIIKEELEKSCDEVMMEVFKCHPRAFLGWIKLISFFTPASIILFLFLQVISIYIWMMFFSAISFILIFLAVLTMWEEFFNYNEFIDFLFRKKTSQNVIGKFKSNSKLKRIIIFSSHIDSALEFKLLKWLGWKAIPLLLGAISIILIWFILSFLNFLMNVIGIVGFTSILYVPTLVILIISIPCFITVFFFVPLGDKGNVVPGAVDNLSSCSVIVGLSRFLKSNKEVIPDNTEIRLISFGCEESGLRGSYRYTEAHLNELIKHDTLVVNMDGLETPDGFLVIDFEPTTRTKHSEEVVIKLLSAAESLNIKAKRFGSGKLEKSVGRLSGGSDAAAFSKAGIKAGFINSADWKNRSSYYHQSGDTLDKIEKGTLENAFKICIAFIINESKPKE